MVSPELAAMSSLNGGGARPRPSQLQSLRASNSVGLLAVAAASLLTSVSLFLSSLPGLPVWLAGQLLLSVALMQWFVILHECGHGTLFRTRRYNLWIGHLASVFSFIPYLSWKGVHAKHHKWTGWQDLDPTTLSLVPRPLKRLERIAMNVCWRWWIPLFSITYRVTIFWNLNALRRTFPDRRSRNRITINVMMLIGLYLLSFYVVGPLPLLRLFGLAVLLQLVFQDPLLLSQHTHIPQNLSDGKKVRPYPALEQEVFTRSLRFPPWFSRCILLNFDAHELHHMYPFVPGYHLDRIRYAPHNEMNWWQWIRNAKQLPGEIFLFQNRNQTELDI